MAMKPVNNPQLDLACEFVKYTSRNIFLTGKAGTGKTTFLKNLKNETFKRMVVVAPTGVAAINAGGVTIHSFFQLSFGPQLPDESEKNEEGSFIRRFSKQKINIIKTIDLLVIDEISMVRADLLDGIDRTLRRFRKNKIPFGGVQLLMIGDLQQLAPVVNENEWSLLEKHYSTPFFFGSNALNKTTYVSIELKHVYRQSDQEFISLLNKVRENILDERTLNKLNSRYISGVDTKEGYITLTTHNAKANNINEARLAEISRKQYSYSANITGNFPETFYPNDYELILKEGAQVMFIKNDPDPEKRYFNGKIGVISELDDNTIVVKCDDGDEPIFVERLNWEKIKYSIDKDKGTINEELEGVYNQYPLKLAWAITIHKSQGLTFDNAIIDAADAFTHGQVYVALSRCRTLEGLILSSKISPATVFSNQTISTFNADIESGKPDAVALENDKKQYLLDVLSDLYDFAKLAGSLRYIIKVLSDNHSSIPSNPLNEFEDIQKLIYNDLVAVANKFRSQLVKHISYSDKADISSELQERIKKASEYFHTKLKGAAEDMVTNHNIETDNKAVRKTLNNAIENFSNEYSLKYACLEITKSGFVLKDYLEQRAKALLEPSSKIKKPKKEVTYSGDENKELSRILKAWRDEKARENNCAVYQIIQLKTINEICHYLPSTPDELLQMKGMGEKRLKEYSDELLDIIADYKGEYRTEGAEIVLPKKKKGKENTKNITLELYNEGNTIEKISEIRSFSIRTIEGHLAYFVGTGELAVSEFVSAGKVKKAIPIIEKLKTTLLSEIKQTLDELSYSEIRFIVEHMKSKGIIV